MSDAIDGSEALRRFQAQYGEKPQKSREARKTLGKDDFMKIMLTQMKNQDPLNPFKTDQMGTQIAQFTSVEQLQNMNQNLNKISQQNKPIEQLAMTQLIGQWATVDMNRFKHIESENDTISFVLPEGSKQVEVTLVNEAGEEVLKKDMGPQNKGKVSFNWDGIKSNAQPAKSGYYIVKVNALDDRNQSISVDQRSKARIMGMSFEQSGEPLFLIGNGERVTLRNIVKIEASAQQGKPE